MMVMYLARKINDDDNDDENDDDENNDDGDNDDGDDDDDGDDEDENDNDMMITKGWRIIFFDFQNSWWFFSTFTPTFTRSTFQNCTSTRVTSWPRRVKPQCPSLWVWGGAVAIFSWLSMKHTFER